jgi:hypothetical protein
MPIAGGPGNWYKIAKLAQRVAISTTTISKKVPLILRSAVSVSWRFGA